MWRWILAAVLVLLVLLGRTRVGVMAAFGKDGLRLDITAGVLRLHILPVKRKKRKKEKPAKTKKPSKKKRKKNQEKPALPSIAREDIEDALRTMLPALKRTLKRFRRGIRLRPLRLSVTLGGQEDPFAATLLYSRLQAAVWTGMPILEKLVDIREPHIHTGIDFEAAGTAVEGEAGVSFRIGTLAALGLGLAFPALGWFLRWRKRSKARPPEPPKEKKKKGPEAPSPEKTAA